MSARHDADRRAARARDGHCPRCTCQCTCHQPDPEPPIRESRPQPGAPFHMAWLAAHGPDSGSVAA